MRTAVISVATPRALYFDPASGTFRFASSGELADLDPVDHAVAMIVGIARGSLPCAPGAGNRLRELLARAPESARQTTATYAARDMFAPLIDAGDVALGEVTVDVSERGVVTIAYVNLRTARASSRTVRAR